jgi:acetyl esterase/lipase
MFARESIETSLMEASSMEEALTLDGREAAPSTYAAVSPFRFCGRVYHFFEHLTELAVRCRARRRRGQEVCREFQIGDSMKAIEVVVPSARDGYAILHLHGGAHATGSMWFYKPFLKKLSEATSSHVFSINYRKTPEHAFPAQLDDTLAAWRWLLGQGYSPKSIAVLGDSAGGNLAFALSVRLAQLKEQQPAACLGFSPWLLLAPDLVAQRAQNQDGIAPVTFSGPDQSDRTTRRSIVHSIVRAIQESSVWVKGAEFFMGQYFQAHDPTDPLISPLLVSDEMLKAFPPVLLHVDIDEPLAVEAKEMAARCEAVGVKTELHFYVGTMHGMQIVSSSFREEASNSLSRVHVFLEELWTQSTSVARTEEVRVPSDGGCCMPVSSAITSMTDSVSTAACSFTTDRQSS